ncbi:hypothetical protein DV736_g3560, partial [Chaetothyriales sp. CBS 134916]
MIHEIDLLQLLIGRITRVYAEKAPSTRGYDAEEGVALILKFDNGAVGTFLALDNASSPFTFEQATGEFTYHPYTGQDCYRIFGRQGTLNIPQNELWTPEDLEKGWKSHLKKDIIPYSDVRSQLFTENEQQRTSEVLIAHVPDEDTIKILQDIDLLVENTSTGCQTDRQITRGPFGAFQLAAPVQKLNIDTFSDLLEINNDPNLSDLDMIFGVGMSAGEHDLGVPEPNMIPNAAFPLPALPAFDSIADQTLHRWTEDENAHSQSQSQYQYLPKDGLNPVQSLVVNPIDQQNTVLHEAPFLLKNYLESVINSQTPVQSDKTPWHTLFFAHAKDAYATMILANAPDHASLSVFYAILAISAFSHRTSSESQRWHQLANQYRAKAKGYLQRAWLDAFCIPKNIKYKAVLMGLLAMIQVSAFAGVFNEAECYLLDAEKFIRLYGLTKPSKSRRSTFVLGPELGDRELVLGATEDLSTLTTPEQDSPAFKLGRWRELDENMSEIKSKESDAVVLILVTLSMSGVDIVQVQENRREFWATARLLNVPVAPSD